MAGRSGNDIYFVDNAGDSVTENGGQGTDEVRASVSYMLTAGADVEILRTIDDDGVAAIDLTGNVTGNVVRGNNGANVINGGAGDDELTGRGGAGCVPVRHRARCRDQRRRHHRFHVADDTIRLENAIFGGSLPAVSRPTVRDRPRPLRMPTTTSSTTTPPARSCSTATAPARAAAIQFADVGCGLALTNNDFLVV